MKYNMTEPCDACPFLKGSPLNKTLPKGRLLEFASGEFACHKACEERDGDLVAKNDKTPHCAGALIFNEKRNTPTQMMRIAERLGMYDRTKLNMKAPVVIAKRT